MKVSESQKAVLREMGQRHNALVNGDEGPAPDWWIEGGRVVHSSVAKALVRKGLVELTGKVGGQPGILFFTATERGRVVVFQI